MHKLYTINSTEKSRVVHPDEKRKKCENIRESAFEKEVVHNYTAPYY